MYHRKNKYNKINRPEKRDIQEYNILTNNQVADSTYINDRSSGGTKGCRNNDRVLRKAQILKLSGYMARGQCTAQRTGK